MEWQPIETAPKTGEQILLASKHGFVTIGKWTEKFAPVYGDESAGWYCYQLDRRMVNVAHWMPVPKAPNTGELT